MMEGGRRYLALLTLLQLYQGLNGELQISPSLIVNPGESAAFMCKYNGAIDNCQFTVGGQNLFLKPGKEKDGISYHGQGTDVGECGIMIKNTQERHNGNVSCAVAPGDSKDPTALTGTMKLVVALAPQKPELDVSVGTENNVNTYRERDLLSASCIVRDGRPAANITWYMGDEVITEGLKMPIETCTPQKKELCTIQQNLTRTLHANDDKKVLKCVANHHALRGRDLVAEYTINVNYPPKPSYKALERFGLVEGAIGRVPIMIEANPKPIISWTIGGDVVYEGTTNTRYTVEPTLPKGPGQYETVLVIDSLTREDTDKEYKVTAHNDLGEAHYTVIISTSPEPRVLEMGAGLIIIIVGAIVVILLILGGVFYARAKGKLCFADAASPRTAGESSDTESADHHPDRKPKLSFISVFKKKGDKIAADDKEMLKNITVDDEKAESVEQPAEKTIERDGGESVVYAELDLGGAVVARPGPAVVVRGDDDKTEYAEIIHTHPPAPTPTPPPTK